MILTIITATQVIKVYTQLGVGLTEYFPGFLSDCGIAPDTGAGCMTRRDNDQFLILHI